MRKFLIVISLLIVSLLTFSACVGSESVKSENLIPENNISYTRLSYGNVIQEGKQAVFLNFTSDYNIERIKIEGNLLDNKGNIIYTFNESMSFGSSSNKCSAHIMVDSNLIKSISTASFTKIEAYTKDEIN